ncbi:hypothetical protein KMZ14_06230 [Acinetobacter schindleri]|uniref:hypothetical protein n=1 Tax=Acinetobacter schindleri TaxID=108981 RepID=UPI00236023DF|nr:hypothetical protein [Acinetobacter schindleri]WDE17558.1 hypothetical protein KMZ14_06230 [Acinetobacter schindleri]
MDIKESKELSFDTQDFPKEVWVFDADNLDQGTEISHLMMSHAEQYTKDELLEICRQASMVIDQLRAELAKAQAVPEGFVLIKDDTKTVVAIERMVEQQVEASGMDSRRLERLDGWKIIEAAVKAQEPAND